MSALNSGWLVDEVVSRSLWAFQGVGQPDGIAYGHRSVADRMLVGWAAPSDALGAEAALGPVDARRVDAFTPERRRSFLTGRAVLGRLLGELVPGSAAWTVDTAVREGSASDHGPVAVRGVPALASIAHTSGLVVVAVAATNRAIRLGVDVEADRPDPERSASLARMLQAPDATAQRRWTEVQAVLKASGHGLRVEPAQVRFGPGSARIEGTSSTYRVAHVDGPPGFLVSLAWQPASAGSGSK